VSRVRENRMPGSTGGGWKRNATASPRQSPTQPTSPNGRFAGSLEDALDCACGLYLNDPTAWLPDPSPTN
jgi:hypothetical protein